MKLIRHNEMTILLLVDSFIVLVFPLFEVRAEVAPAPPVVENISLLTLSLLILETKSSF